MSDGGFPWDGCLLTVIVVGAAEKESRTVNMRVRDDPATHNKGDLVPLDEALATLEALNRPGGKQTGKASELNAKEARLRALAAQLGKDYDEL